MNIVERPYTAEELDKIIEDRRALLAALKGLFEHCCMVHRHWGEGSNLKEANAAEEVAKEAIAKAEEP